MNQKMLLAVVLPLALVACGKPASTPDQPQTGATPSEPTLATGVGTITAIDEATNMVTLDHGPVAELKWPAMKMQFRGTAAMLHGLAAGERVAFSFKWDGKAGQLVAIKRKLT
jgi:Cu(I)/Ag(I) efflux system protein CusF